MRDTIWMFMCILVHLYTLSCSKPGHKNPSLHIPFPVMLFSVRYDLRPGVLIKSPKGKGWVRKHRIHCPLWLYPTVSPVAPNLGSRFSSPHPIRIIKLSWGGGRSWAHSGNWRIEQQEWVVGSSGCRCFPSGPRCSSAHLTSHPGLPGLLPQRELRDFQLEEIEEWIGLIPDLGDIGWSEPPQAWGQRQWFYHLSHESFL